MTPTPEDVERVAKIIWGDYNPRQPWWAISTGTQDIYRAFASSALAAMPDHTALLRECAEALKIARNFARIDFTTGEWKKIDAALARVREALGEKP